MIKKYELLSIKPYKHPFLFLLYFLVFTPLFISLFLLKTYDSYLGTGLIKDNETCTFSTSLTYENVDVLEDGAKIKYKNKMYSIDEIVYGEPYLDNGVVYEDVDIISSFECNGKIINFSILYNEQRIFDKIKKIILEGN